jgi:hypothetical protein
MDLLETWKKLDDAKLSKPVEGYIVPPHRSRHTLARLRQNYFIKMSMAAAFAIGFIILFVVVDHVIIRAFLAIVILGYVAFLYSSISILRNFKDELPVDHHLIQVLRHMKYLIESNLLFEKRVGLTVYPFACSAGFLVGFLLAGGDVNEVFNETFLLVMLIATAVVLTPLCYFFAQWLHKRSYKKCLDDLSSMIADLESKV